MTSHRYDVIGDSRTTLRRFCEKTVILLAEYIREAFFQLCSTSKMSQSKPATDQYPSSYTQANIEGGTCHRDDVISVIFGPL